MIVKILIIVAIFVVGGIILFPQNQNFYIDIDETKDDITSIKDDALNTSEETVDNTVEKITSTIDDVIDTVAKKLV